jgi:hypothetical protein
MSCPGRNACPCFLDAYTTARAGGSAARCRIWHRSYSPGGAEILTDATLTPTVAWNRTYCFAPVQLPAQPSDRRNVPDPLRPEKRPDIVQLRLPADPIPDTPPFGLTCAVPYCPTILPLEMTTVSVELPQGVPTLVRIHAPSILPPPPTLFRDARLGASVSVLLRRAGFEGSAARGVSREPDSDFSSLPMLPPALPDCACPRLGRATMASVADSRAALVRYRMRFGKIHWFPMNRVLTAGPVGTNSADNAGKIRRCRRTRQALRPCRGYPTRHSSTPSSAVTTLPTEPTGVRSRFSKCLSVAPSLAGMRASARASASVRIITTPCSTSPLPL